jgi:endonuclease-3
VAKDKFQEAKPIHLEMYERLKRAYPNADCTLFFRNPRELLVATILSAQCTDKRVNQITPRLFKKYPSAWAFANTIPEELEKDIRPTGFYVNKAKAIIAAMEAVERDFQGEVPQQLEDLVRLRGVGRKTANVVRGVAFGIAAVVVDTHVKRLAGRMGLTKSKNPDKIEHDLMILYPREEWTLLGHIFIQHGRQVCVARRPRCTNCVLNDICPRLRLVEKNPNEHRIVNP